MVVECDCREGSGGRNGIRTKGGWRWRGKM